MTLTTIPDTPPRHEYVGAGGQTVFTYSFPVFNAEDLQVYRSTSGKPGPADILTLNVDYTVTGAGTDSGGTVVLTAGASAGEIIVIRSGILLDRTTQFTKNGPFTNDAINQQLNELTRMLQQLLEIKQSRYAEDDPSYSFPLPVGTATAPAHAVTLAQLEAAALAPLGSLTTDSFNFTQDGAGAVVRTVSSRLKDVVSVKDFGAVADGVTNDHAAFAAAFLLSDKDVYIPSGTYLINSPLSFDSKRVFGAGRRNCVIQKNFSGDLFTVGDRGSIEALTIVGNGGTHTGRNIVINTGNDQQFIDVWSYDSNGYALEVTAINAALRMLVQGGFYGRTTSTNLAIKLPNGAETAGGRKFMGISQQGFAFIDLGDSENSRIVGCNFSGITFGSDCQKAVIVGNRIPNTSTLTVDGSSHVITGNAFGSHNVILGTDCTDTVCKANVIANGFVIRDESNAVGANLNDVDEAHSVAVVWKGDTTDPAIGNGQINGRFARNGRTVTLSINLSIGSTTTLGSGNWYFELPSPYDVRVPAQSAPGVLLSIDIGTTEVMGSCRVENVGNVVRVRAYPAINGTTPFSWVAGDLLQLNVTYELG